jgi:hypothetical protein
MHEKIDVTGLLENRDAIWKAAVLAYFNGEKPFLNIQDELSSEQENKAYEPEDIWLAPMEHWLNKLRLERQFTTAEALVGAGLRQRDHLSSDDQRRAAVVLRELGCVQEKNPIRVQGKRARVWSVGTDGTAGTDPSEGSVPAEINCTGTGPSVLAQITDKKVKTFEFLSTEGTTATEAPVREKNAQVLGNHLCICANTFEPAALQPFSAGTDPKKHLCQAPASVPGNKPIKCSDTNAIDRKQAEQRIRAHGKTHDLSALTDAEVFSDLKSLDAALARQVGRSVT